MKKILFTLLLIIIFLVGMCPASAQERYCRIVLLADTHLPVRSREVPDEAKKQRILLAKNKVIDDINSWNDVSEIVVLGDIVAEFGNESEYLYAKEYFSRLNKPVSFITGNHDYIYTDNYSAANRFVLGDADSRAAKSERFRHFADLDRLYYSKRVGNYLLIFLAVDSLDSRYLCQLSAVQLAWLRQELQTHSHLPTIVFFHAPLDGTLLSNSPQANKANFVAQPKEAINDILANNPQIMLWVSGHTHTAATNPSFAHPVNLYNKKVANIHNADMDRETIWTNSLYLYPDKVVVRTYNHHKGSWLPDLDRSFPVE